MLWLLVFFQFLNCIFFRNVFFLSEWKILVFTFRPLKKTGCSPHKSLETKPLVTIDPGDKWATFSKRTLASQALGELGQREKRSEESSVNHSEPCAGVCGLPLHTDLDKFKMSESIFCGSLISRSSSWWGAAARVASMALEMIIAAIICFQGWGPAVKG